MSEALQRSRCGKCGAVLGGCAPESLCAFCLLDSALEGDDSDSVESVGSASLRRFQDYEIVEEIARGGMGVVYRARQISLNRPVALKMMLGGHLANAAEMKRFRAEAETAAQLQHPNIVAIHEVGEHAGQPFFSMDLIEGRNLAEVVRDEPLPSHKAAGYLKTVAEAVHYAHSQGVLHRDLKPSNILIDQSDQPQVTDFGLAKRLEADASLTITGQVLGSPSFIPPEQAAGHKTTIGPASDVYSLGAVLYHCLTARPPFVAETMTATLRMVAEDEPVSPRLLNASVPSDLETICLKCLDKDPARRYLTAQELADDLNRFLYHEPIQARPAGVMLKAHRWCLRNKALAVAVTVSLALLLVVSTGSPLVAIRINRERRQAELNEQKARTEAIKSQTVANILKQTLRSAGPSFALGRDATLLREMLEASVEVSSKLKDQPEVRADIYSTIGLTFLDIGEHQRAVTNFEQAVRSYRLAFEGDRTNLAYTLGALGFCQSFTGDIARGSNNARLGMEMARRCGDQGILSTCLLNYSLSFRAWGMVPPETEPYLREVFELKKQAGNDPVGLATAMNMLTACSTNSEENEQLLRDALAMLQKHLPPGHPKIVETTFVLGQNLVRNGKLQDAERTLKEALQGFHNTHDANHPYQSIVLRYLIRALVGQGKMKEAEALLCEHVKSFAVNANYLSMLIRFRMQHGSPGGAGEPLPPDLKAKLEKGEFSGLWAISLLHVGANDEYQEYRRRYLDVAFARNDFRGKMGVAKDLLLGEGEPREIERACQFAELAITNATDADRYTHLEQLNALLNLRRGQFASVRRWANRDIAKHAQWKLRLCEAWSIKALACARLQLPNPALDAIAKAKELLKPHLPEGEEAYLFAGDEWILSRYLAGQAKKAVAALSPPSDPANAEAGEPADPIDSAIESNWRVNIFISKGQWQEAALELAKATVCLRQSADSASPEFSDLLAEMELKQIDVLIRVGRWAQSKPNPLQDLDAALAKAAPFARGQVYGRAGRFEEAAASLRQSIESDPKGYMPYFLLAPILLFNADIEGYRQHCQQALARFADTQDAGPADTIAKACLLLPSVGVDSKAVDRLANTAVTLGQQSEYFAWFQLCKALSEYRQKHFSGAVEWAQKSLAAAPQAERNAAAWLVQAMAQARLNQPAAARDAFEKGAELVEKQLPKLDSGDLGVQWVDVIIANLLLREARGLMPENSVPQF